MAERFIASEEDRGMLVTYVMQHSLPFTINITKGDARSYAQNRLQHMWVREIAEQNDGNQTPEEVRGFCKLHLGVPIMREHEKFRAAYDQHIKRLPYESKLALMMEPIDTPVTRLMSAEQMARYLDAIWLAFNSKGYKLTDPDERLYKAMVATRNKEAA